MVLVTRNAVFMKARPSGLLTPVLHLVNLPATLERRSFPKRHSA
jgi:hypothetical protein